ncbi:MAG: SOS response-associated peptidase [Burkholderiales bacterium]|nr:SOS response-associated peptidase [Burkholderiales bacterium]
MCGRYELHTHPAALALLFGLPHPPAIGPRYNMAPTQDVPVIRRNRAGERELAQVRWGLVPRWAKDPSIGARLINARAETVADKPAFRMALRHHRCLVPADGFYEWMPRASGGKQPMHVGMRDGGTFAMAGLTERWLSPEGHVLDSCAIVTTQSNALLAPVHDRMPVIIAPEHYERWLVAAGDDVADLLVPYPAQAMTFYPVSTRVNAVRNDDASLIEEAAAALPREADDPPPAHPEDDEHVPEQANLF